MANPNLHRIELMAVAAAIVEELSRADWRPHVVLKLAVKLENKLTKDDGDDGEPEDNQGIGAGRTS